MNQRIRAVIATAITVATVSAPAVAASMEERTPDTKRLGTTSVAKVAAPKRVVFKAWGVGVPNGMVDVSAKNDIEMMRRLPYTQVAYLSGWDLSFADISVEHVNGYGTVGCEIRVNGLLRARDVSDYGFAWCTL